MLRRIRKHAHRSPSMMAEVYELDCGHLHTISDVMIANARLYNSFGPHAEVNCSLCDNAAHLPDTVSDCFRQVDEG